MVSIKDIAKECGVSIATVSNTLNGKGNIGDNTRKRVLAVAKEMNYIPNFMAKNLKQKSTKIIGIITEDLTVFNCPEIVDGINQYLEEKGYTFLLGNLRLYKKYDNRFYSVDEYHDQVEDEFSVMSAKNVDGIIYIGAHCRNITSIPKNFDIPIVVTYGYTDDVSVPSIVFDDEKAAFDATMHLIHSGHKRIGLISGENHSLHAENRLLGYQRALFENSILFDPKLVRRGDWQRDKAYEACRALMEQGVTAIFAMNDIMAAGVYDYLHKMGLFVGQDLKLIGFDNREISTVFEPQLTTMALPLNSMGQSAAKVMLDILGDGEHADKTHKTHITQIECELIQRGSA